MDNDVKTKKVFSIQAMIAIEAVILYVVLRVGDVFYSVSNVSIVLTRYIPIGIATIVFTYFLVRSGAKKTAEFEKEDFIKKVKIIPIIVAVVLLAFGFFSVQSNVSKYEDKISTYKRIYSMIDKNSLNEVDKIVNEAKGRAVMSWGVTTVIYFVLAEVTTFFVKERLDDLFLDEES